MENATDALIMAGQILVFILALTLCMSSFSTLRTSITELIEQPEVIKMTKNSEGYLNFIESNRDKSIRMVGAETVVASMYRAVKENYIVYIKLKNDPPVSYNDKIVLTKAIHDIIVDGNTIISQDDDLIEVSIGRPQDGINERVNEILTGSDGLYNIIKDMKFNEYLGEYQDGTNASTENKITKRIITYIQA